MKTSILKTSAYVCVTLLLLAAFSTTSCKKDKTCRGKVTVIDTAGNKVAGATVKASYGQTEYSSTTDGSGVASIDLKLPAILNIEATSNSFPGMVGKGILRLDEPGKTADVTVTLK